MVFWRELCYYQLVVGIHIISYSLRSKIQNRLKICYSRVNVTGEAVQIRVKSLTHEYRLLLLTGTNTLTTIPLD